MVSSVTRLRILGAVFAHKSNPLCRMCHIPHFFPVTQSRSVSAMSNTMHCQHYTASFLTPTFLGNASQNAQWRTPPFKALLRQWWRVAWAAEHGTDFQRMRHEEGLLFGHAWLETDSTAARKSLVRLRLSSWEAGKQNTWQPLNHVKHPEVPSPVDAGLYLGYGPLIYDKSKKGPVFKSNAAIQAGESAKLSIAYPESEARLIETALNLMHHFGTLGGRSRNGWGSLHMEHENGETIAAPSEKVFKNWRDALQCDWPHAIGKDEKGALIWRTRAFDDWRGIMQELARIKIALRTHFAFHSGNNAPAPEQRHWLGYPVTNHSVKPWGNNARLPNSLRFKVCRDSNGKPVGKIFHIPCLPPPAFSPNQGALESVWRAAHQFLDSDKTLARAKN